MSEELDKTLRRMERAAEVALNEILNEWVTVDTEYNNEESIQENKNSTVVRDTDAEIKSTN